METRGRARYGEGILGLLHRGELLFEGLHLRPHRQPLAGDDALNGIRLFVPVIQIAQRNPPINQDLFLPCGVEWTPIVNEPEPLLKV